MNIENIPFDLIVRGVRHGIRWIRRRQGREIANFVINFPKTGYVERIADAERLARELSRLDDHAPRVVEIRDLGGSGKSWFTWNFFKGLKAHRLRFKFRIWFSFYKLENTIDPFLHFLDWTLQGLDPSFYKYRDSNVDAKSSKLLEILQQTRSLLVLDGLEITQNASLRDLGRLKDRCFRAFLCAACNFTRSRVIVTTRLKLTDICGKQGHAEFHMSEWSVSEFREFLGPNAPTPNLEVTQKVIKTLGSHPLSLAVFRYSLLTYHNGDFSLTEETLGEILSIKRTGKSKFEQQQEKLRVLICDLWDRLSQVEKEYLKKLSSLYGSISTDCQSVLAPSISNEEFIQLTGKFSSLALINVGKKGGREKITAHPLIKSAVYGLMDEEERSIIHHNWASYFAGFPRPSKPEDLADLDNLMEWFQQCVKGKLFNKAFNVYTQYDLRNMLYFGGWFHAHLELLSSLSRAVLEEPKATGLVETEQITLFMVLGHISRKLGRLREALRYFCRARRIAQKSCLKLHSYEANVEIGVTYGFIGKFRRVLELLPANSLHEESFYDGPRLEWLGYAHAMLGDTTEGIRFLREAILLSDIVKTERDSRHLPCELSHLGDIYLIMRDMINAKKNYDGALHASTSKDYKDYEGDALRGLGDYYRFSKKRRKSEQCLQKAYTIAKEIGYRYLEAEVLLCRAKNSLVFGRDNAKATNYAESALEIAQESGYLLLQAEACITLIKLTKASGMEKNIRGYLEKAERISQTIGVMHIQQQVENLKNEISN